MGAAVFVQMEYGLSQDSENPEQTTVSHPFSTMAIFPNHLRLLCSNKTYPFFCDIAN